MRAGASEAAGKADFSRIRYAQCWEDADVLVEGLDPQPGEVCLSIASAGDNALALLTRDPARVVAVDLNPSQLFCLELRVAAYRELEHEELLELVGSRQSERRWELYQRCRKQLSDPCLRFWDAHRQSVVEGIGDAGKFEYYFRLFRKRVLPFAHTGSRVAQLLESRERQERKAFYRDRWDSWRWRLLFHVFFSRFAMGRLGRDPRFFDYVEGSVARRILDRVEHALTELDPAANPYLQWILRGTHETALPLALRKEHFETIRNKLDRLEWRLCSLEDYCRHEKANTVSRFNLSDIFEYMSETNYESLLEQLLSIACPGGRLAYWNMLAPRSRPSSLATKLEPLESLSTELHLKDKAFFYSRFVVERVL